MGRIGPDTEAETREEIHNKHDRRQEDHALQNYPFFHFRNICRMKRSITSL